MPIHRFPVLIPAEGALLAGRMHRNTDTRWNRSRASSRTEGRSGPAHYGPAPGLDPPGRRRGSRRGRRSRSRRRSEGRPLDGALPVQVLGRS